MSAYDNVKLGLFDRFRVWREMRAAEKFRDWYDKIEGEVTEVDDSGVDKFKEELLEQKRMKKATRDAKKLFRRYNNKEKYGYDVWDGEVEDDFIKSYLEEQGLIKKKLPEPEMETSKRQEFISKYSTQKSEEEIAYEKANIEPRIFYKIADKEYELPKRFSDYAMNYNNGIDDDKRLLPIEEKGNKKYIIDLEKLENSTMEPFEKEELLYEMASSVLSNLQISYNDEAKQYYGEEDQQKCDEVRKMANELKMIKNSIGSGKTINAINHRLAKMLEINEQMKDDKGNER